ncbi:helix-turn-helix domain-containing protein [Candidatus Woesearchaeota archaeon]|nr:helix-turn-helix domain-containing protein [Candidatus Woesearchaeota archaeon]
MYEKTLMQIGLSLNEARVYEALMQLGEVNVNTISIKSKVHRRNVYDSLNKLIEKGLVAQYVLKEERHFRATDPDRLQTLLFEKEDNLKKILPDMKSKFQRLKQEEQAYIYRGVQGFKNYMQDILDVGEDFYCIGAKGGWFDPRLEVFRIRFYRELTKKKIHCYHLFDSEMRAHVGKEIVSPVGVHLHEARFLPKECSTNAAIDFFGDRIVTFTGLSVNKLDDDMVQFVLISRELCEAYKKWFWLMWKGSTAYKK